MPFNSFFEPPLPPWVPRRKKRPSNLRTEIDPLTLAEYLRREAPARKTLAEIAVKLRTTKVAVERAAWKLTLTQPDRIEVDSSGRLYTDML